MWNQDIDFTLLYMRDYLGLTFPVCAEILRREFNFPFNKDRVIGRHRRLKANGVTYTLQPGEDV